MLENAFDAESWWVLLLQVWEAAMKAVEVEELNKQRLCDDLKCLVCQLSPWKFYVSLNPNLDGFLRPV